MMNIPKMVMILGVIIFVIGFAMKYIHLGRLPGDIFLKKGNTTFTFLSLHQSSSVLCCPPFFI